MSINFINVTIDSIEQLVNVYKEDNSRNNDYGIGYDDAMKDVLRNLAIYRKIVQDKHEEAALSE